MANKLLKDTPVHVSCPHCGKLQHPRLKWAKNHRSLKCKHCGKAMDLREKQAHSLIQRTLNVVMSFDKVLQALHAEAKKAGKAVKAKTKKKKPKKEKTRKKPAKKSKAAKRLTKRAKPVSMMPPEVGTPSGGGQPSP
ncbi:MAG TPA: hypothetical protein VGO35_09560 [Gammaproteobacteria bacterium]|jgi:transcription elongation factor Elf1|nr:hypothetical protein [Gammaproteobacteria bacterium]